MSEQKRQGRDPRESMAPTVRIDPVGEAIARKLSGYGGVPNGEKDRMIMRAVKAGRDAVHEEVEQLRQRVQELEAENDRQKDLIQNVVYAWSDATLNSVFEGTEAALPELVKEMGVGLRKLSQLKIENEQLRSQNSSKSYESFTSLLEAICAQDVLGKLVRAWQRGADMPPEIHRLMDMAHGLLTRDMKPELGQLKEDAELGRAVREEIPKLAAQLSPRGRASLSFLREGAWQIDEYRSAHCPAAVHATPLEAIKAARQAMEWQRP